MNDGFSQPSRQRTRIPNDASARGSRGQGSLGEEHRGGARQSGHACSRRFPATKGVGGADKARSAGAAQSASGPPRQREHEARPAEDEAARAKGGDELAGLRQEVEAVLLAARQATERMKAS